jgi:probable HAF family extracellular repeat protein
MRTRSIMLSILLVIFVFVISSYAFDAIQTKPIFTKTPLYPQQSVTPKGLSNNNYCVGDWDVNRGFYWVYNGQFLSTQNASSQDQYKMIGINSAGTIAGHHLNYKGYYFICTWSSWGSTPIVSTTPGETGAINESGCVAGTLSSGKLFIMRNGLIDSVALPTEINNAERVVVTHINNSGTITGYVRQTGLYSGLTANSTAFIYDSGRYIYPVNKTYWSIAYAINDSGTVVGTYNTGSAQNAFLFSNGVITDVPLGSNYGALACDINNNGTIVGKYSTGYLWAGNGTLSTTGFIYLNGKIYSGFGSGNNLLINDKNVAVYGGAGGVAMVEIIVPASVIRTSSHAQTFSNIVRYSRGHLVFSENYPRKLISQISMYDLNGKLVLEKTLSSNGNRNIPISYLAKGNYLISIKSNNGIQHITQRLAIP